MVWNTSAAMDVLSCNTSSYFLCWGRIPILTFFVQFESKPWQKLRSVTPTYMTDRCFQKLLSSTWYIKWMIWNSLVAMAAFPCNASPYFWCWDSTPNLTFCVQFESQPWQKLHNVNHKWLTDSFRSSSHLHYISMEGYETLHKQWMFFPAAHHPIFPAERVSQI